MVSIPHARDFAAKLGHVGAFDRRAVTYAAAWKQPEGAFAGLPMLQAIFSLGAGVDHLFKDTKLPDYVVLISTLGGIEAFGLNGFVIGPVIAAMFIAVWDIFSISRKEDQAAIMEERP